MNDGQSIKHSWLESVSNVVFGYIVALTTAWIVFPWFGVETSMQDNAGITACFTTVTLIRSYLIRRFFNKHTEVKS